MLVPASGGYFISLRTVSQANERSFSPTGPPAPVLIYPTFPGSEDCVSSLALYCAALHGPTSILYQFNINNCIRAIVAHYNRRPLGQCLYAQFAVVGWLLAPQKLRWVTFFFLFFYCGIVRSIINTTIHQHRHQLPLFPGNSRLSMASMALMTPTIN